MPHMPRNKSFTAATACPDVLKVQGLTMDDQSGTMLDIPGHFIIHFSLLAAYAGNTVPAKMPLASILAD